MRRYRTAQRTAKQPAQDEIVLEPDTQEPGAADTSRSTITIEIDAAQPLKVVYYPLRTTQQGEVPRHVSLPSSTDRIEVRTAFGEHPAADAAHSWQAPLSTCDTATPMQYSIGERYYNLHGGARTAKQEFVLAPKEAPIVVHTSVPSLWIWLHTGHKVWTAQIAQRYLPEVARHMNALSVRKVQAEWRHTWTHMRHLTVINRRSKTQPQPTKSTDEEEIAAITLAGRFDYHV